MPSEAPKSIWLQPKTNDCYVCGPNNSSGLRVPFAADGVRGCRAVYTAQREHCGWPGVLHGGVAFMLMDEALAWSLYFQGLYGVTARVETRFRRPIAAGTKLLIRAWTIEQRRNIVDARAEIRAETEDGLVLAEARASMFLQEVEGFEPPRRDSQENAAT